jgi:cellulose synthase/poly-beta-1,6-N-acetylglucosamine synthase-like glycosyltransferase
VRGTRTEHEDASMDTAAALPVQHSLARTTERSADAAGPPFLSVIIPCYNEEQRIGPTLTAIERHLAASGLTHELIVVDDGSTDGTLDLVAARARLNGALRVLGVTPNRG